ncbi:hypothetical protein ACWEGE_14455 [Amycolatopsis sp. NPDC004747]
MAVLVPVLLLVALWSGWLGWLVADGGPVRKTLEALSWLAAVAAVVFSLVELRRRKPAVSQSVYVGRALHLDGDRLPKVADVSLLALRVKRAVDTFDAEGRDLPRYVARDRDEDLEWAIATGGLVLLHGRAAAGKSRAAAEAVRRLRPGHDLLVPVDAPALRKIAESGLTDTVVWLDDLERFLVPGGLDVGLFQRLAPSVCMVATIRDHELAVHRTVEGAINKAAADLIASIPPSHLIAIEQRLTEAEQERARTAQAGDPRIGRALEASEGFAEYLAAGMPMLERWSVGDSPLFYVGQALISAAVDCRRAGYAEPVPSATLAELYRHYLPTPWCERPDLPPVAEGLEWAARPVLGASSCLQPRTDGSYLASDYLVDRAQEGTSPLRDSPVPDRTWEVLLSLSSGPDAVAVGFGAYDADRFEVAEGFFRHAFETGDEMALGPAAMAIGKLGRFAEVGEIFRNAEQAGNEEVMAYAVLALSEGDRFEDISDLARTAISDSNLSSIYLVTTALSDLGRSADLHDLAVTAIDQGQQKMINAITTSSREHLSLDQLSSLLRHAMESGDDRVVYATLFGLRRPHQRDKEATFEPAFSWLAEQENLVFFVAFVIQAIEAEDFDGLRRLASQLVARNKHDTITMLLRHAIETGYIGSADVLRTFERPA